MSYSERMTYRPKLLWHSPWDTVPNLKAVIFQHVEHFVPNVVHWHVSRGKLFYTAKNYDVSQHSVSALERYERIYPVLKKTPVLPGGKMVVKPDKKLASNIGVLPISSCMGRTRIQNR